MANESFKLEYKLHQQSPMIHFQYREKGATLRATEVKPKLDRYIIKQNGGIKECRKKHKDWFIDENSDALNYKLRLTVNSKPTLNTDIPAPYFGNMGKKSEEKIGTVYYKQKNPINVTIICFNEGLRKAIDECIVEFFIVTNFGTRQNKGFGSFVIKDGDNYPEKEMVADVLKKEYGAKNCYHFTANDYSSALKRINIIYKIMKSGYNFGGDKRRSLLFLYMHTKNSVDTKNEKAFLKEYVKYVNRNRPRPNENEYNYVRALLGVGSAIKIEGKEFEISNSKIARLASPIFFKIIDKDVYYVGGRINNEIYGKPFEFSLNGSHNPVLKVPSEENFDIDGFLHHCMVELKKDKEELPEESTPLNDIKGMQGLEIEEI